MIIRGKKYNIKVAESYNDKTVGLSDRAEIGMNEGMMFPNVNVITMENTVFPLKLVYLDKDYNVIDIKHGAAHASTYYSNQKALHTLELHPDADVEVGDSLKQRDFIFDYKGKFDNGTPFTLEGYKELPTGLVESSDSRVEGKIVEINELNKPYAEIKLADGLYSYDSNPDVMEILDEVGNVQMLIEGGERIISIKETKELVGMVNSAKTPEDYIALGTRLIEIFDAQDNRPPEYV